MAAYTGLQRPDRDGEGEGEGEREAKHQMLTPISPITSVCGLWSVVCGLWSVVCGLWSVVCGLWSVVCGQLLVTPRGGRYGPSGRLDAWRRRLGAV
jgi:hypothetical protein